MIGKIKSLPAGDHLIRLTRYLRGSRGERVAGAFSVNLASDEPAQIIDLMEAQAGLSGRAKKPMLHLSISYSPTDVVGLDQMQNDARSILAALGMKENQAFGVIHDDKRYRHFHLVVNRICADGRCVSDGHSKRKIETALRQIEVERGLQPVPGRLAKVPGQDRFAGPRPSRRGYVQPPAAVVEAMRNARTRPELDAQLAKAGWRPEAAPPRPGQKVGGLVLLGPKGERAKASDCGRDCSGPALARRFAAIHRDAEAGVPVSEATLSPPPPSRSAANKLAQALRKARAKPRLPRMRPPTATGVITRAIRATLPVPKV